MQQKKEVDNLVFFIRSLILDIAYQMNAPILVSKNELYFRIEPGIFNKIPEGQYSIDYCSPNSLATWNRLDLGMRVIYLKLKNKIPELAERFYFEDLRAQTLGSLIDPDNSSKYNFNIFKSIFDEVSSEIKLNGFDHRKTVLPVSAAGSILNGGHRLSAALFHQKEVAYILTDLPPITCDYKYFFDREVPVVFIEQAVLQLLKYMKNGFVAFLWPSGLKKISETEFLFDNIIYKKKLTLTSKGALNLLYQCYHHMDWIGTEENRYQGLHQKLIECFPANGDILMIIFQAKKGIDQVCKLKKKIRDINGIGYSSVHITDTPEESLRIASLLCSENGLHYLNNANLISAQNLERIAQIAKRATIAGVSSDDFLIDGSWLLDLYGLRRAEDIDIIASSSKQNIYRDMEFESRKKEIKHHQKDPDLLIYDAENFFYLFGLKFIGFNQLAVMKKNRNEPKDFLDVTLMQALLENKKFRIYKTRLQQKILYIRIRSRRFFIDYSSHFLKMIGLYGLARFVYLRLKQFTDNWQSFN